MIPKDHNNFKIHRLRVIHLYEADLTALFSIWSRRMVHAATAASCINSGSFGARPGKTSSDPAFIGLLQPRWHRARSQVRPTVGRTGQRGSRPERNGPATERNVEAAGRNDAASE